ncbi:MAG: hypothetical protein R3C19_20580 [Planctomycetaceae bacterium]
MTDGANKITRVRQEESGTQRSATPASASRQQILHDLRNCLYVIRNGLEVLQAGPPRDDNTAMVIRMMQKEETRATQLLQDYEQLTTGGHSGGS